MIDRLREYARKEREMSWDEYYHKHYERIYVYPNVPAAVKERIDKLIHQVLKDERRGKR